MKELLFLLLFIVAVPLLIGRLAGISSNSKSGLVPLATMGGLLMLFILYIVFLDKMPEDKKNKQPSPSSAQSANCNITYINDDYSVYEEKRREQPASRSETQVCNPSMKSTIEYPY
ncbi:MAG: hypothetical protein D3903_14400 [Candidatus Electrothrix sp. GM3_4]|nr:hypothetical protein [Candidatus Electrothrix sp. GM3_4]